MGNRLTSRSPSPTLDLIESPERDFVNDLPAELLINILSYYVASEGHSELLTNVASVCRKWRDLAFSPSLWTTVCDHSLNWKQLLVLSDKGVLVGARNLYLGSMKRMCNVMMNVISRCPNLRALDLTGLEISKDLFVCIGESCPKLESLTLTYNKVKGYLYWDSGIVDILEPVFCSFGRNLKVLSLNYSAPHPDDILLRIAETCHVLEDFQFTDVPLDDNTSDCTFEFPVAEFHRGCPLIQQLSLWGCLLVTNGCEKTDGFRQLKSFSANNCELQNPKLHMVLKNALELKELSLVMVYPVTCNDIMRIETEKLEKLQLEYVGINNLTSLLTRWKKTLADLDLHHFALDISGALYALIQDNMEPPTKNICVSHSCISFAILKSLAQNCPKLSEFCIDSCYSTDETEFNIFSLEELHTFIQSKETK